ncbi:MAG: DUF2493 domain-containing protein [Lachnospiraceae bacterium]|nr:DUF2493 domain-containing protein [Lachnospiraceae bacterium]
MAKYCPEKDSPALSQDCLECTEKTCEYFYCLVVGSRTFTDYDLMKRKLDAMLINHPKTVIVSGGAAGADTLAEKYAKEKGLILKVFPANWEIYGNRAGYKRNEQMHKYISKADARGVVAFWDGESKGTQHNFGLAKKYSNEIRIIKFVPST